MFSSSTVIANKSLLHTFGKKTERDYLVLLLLTTIACLCSSFFRLSGKLEIMTLNNPTEGELLTQLGYRQELQRNFSFLSMVGMAFAILNSWTALAASLNVALPSGGPTAILWGLCLAAIGQLAVSASLAEICSVYPTSGGQYHWTAILSAARYARILSFICGWINVAGWWALTASAGSFQGQLITGIISLAVPSYAIQRWHIFLIYVVDILGALLINIFAVRALPTVNKAAFIWSILGMITISITVIAYAYPKYQNARFVFGGFLNTTGWNDGLAWMLGLLQATLGTTGYDAVAHMVEELPNPARNAPRAMVLSIIIGFFTGFVFLAILLFSLTDVNEVMSSKSGSLLQIFYQATGNKLISILLNIIPVVCMAFASISIMTTASRITYAFARDQGLPLSKSLAQVNSRFNAPINALILNSVIAGIFGCIYLVSTSALNAILSASVVALGVSYAFPIAILVYRGRSILPFERQFRLGNLFGWMSHIIGLVFIAFTTILFLFPPQTPVTWSNMNYTIIAFAIVFIFALFQRIFDGHKNYHGPHVHAKSGNDYALHTTSQRY